MVKIGLDGMVQSEKKTQIQISDKVALNANPR